MTDEERWDEIWDAFKKSGWAQLLELCIRFERKLPDHLWARLIHVSALAGLNRFAEAETILHEIQTNPEAASLKYRCFVKHGEIAEELGRFDEARKAYEAAHNICPDKMPPLIYRGVIELRAGNFEAARGWLNRALQCPAGRFDEAHFNIAGTYLAERNYPKAIEHYQKAITPDPN
jgi:tetratricopeptide (TPR) repeat protein